MTGPSRTERDQARRNGPAVTYERNRLGLALGRTVDSGDTT